MKYKYVLLLTAVSVSILIVLTEVRNPLYLVFSKPEYFKTVLETPWGYSTRNDVLMVIQNQSEWEQAWDKLGISYTPDGESPIPIDFSNTTLICAFRGTCATGGYTIEIKYIGILGDRVHIIVSKNSLHPSGFVTESTTNPTYVVSIAKASLPIEFHVNDEFSRLWVDVPIVVIAIYALAKFQKCKKSQQSVPTA